MMFQWMENQTRNRHAAATRENFTRVMERMPARRQTSRPEPMAKRLKKIAMAVKKFTSMNDLSTWRVGSVVSFCNEDMITIVAMASVIQAKDAKRGPMVSQSVPGCARNGWRLPKKSLR